MKNYFAISRGLLKLNSTLVCLKDSLAGAATSKKVTEVSIALGYVHKQRTLNEIPKVDYFTN